jgi:protein-disulfide isomerase
MTRVLLVAAAGWMLPTAVALAQDTGTADEATIEKLVREIQILRSDVFEQRNEMKTLRNDLRKLQNEVNKLKSSPKHDHNPPPPPDTRVYRIRVGDSPTLGPDDAKVTITEFVCLQCPFCIREWTKLQQIMAEYPDDVKVVFKHFPLSYHKKARPVHAACALAHQEKGPEGFWRMHEMIIAAPKKLEVSDMRGHAEKLGLNMAEFDRMMASHAEIEELLAADKAEATKCGVRSTPSVFINGVRLKPRDLTDYRKRIDAILKEEAGKKPPLEKATGSEKAKRRVTN